MTKENIRSKMIDRGLADDVKMARTNIIDFFFFTLYPGTSEILLRS